MRLTPLFVLALLPCSFAFGGIFPAQGAVNAPECSNYQLLEEADRSLTAPGGFKDDSQMQFGWYRFRGAAGTMMSTTCTPTNQCGTHATGWLQGQHPTQSEGAITVKVCFHWTNCCQFPVSIQVRNCGSFYVYQLMGTPGLLRYCGTGSQSPPSVPVPVPVPSSVSNAPECSNYQLLEEADRSLTAPGGFKDDSQMQFGWYRFRGAAGTMMSTTCTPTNQCGTHATGWLQGQHPTQSEGAITVKVCFHWTNCCQFPVSIQVRNCGSFYVYQLMGTPGLLRYCGTGSQSPPPVPVPVPVPSSVSNAPECSNYQLLEEADRSLSAPGGYIDDTKLQFGWYRFRGAAGTMMSTTCTPKYQCGTHATGWLQGQHPTPSQGAITAQVCFHWANCCEYPVSIQVRNCGSFYVYQLMGTPGLLRYCGTGP